MKFKLKLKIYNLNEVANWQQEHIDEFDDHFERQLNYLRDLGASDDSIAALEADVWKTRKKMIDEFNAIHRRHASHLHSIRYSIYLFLVCVFCVVFWRLI